MSVGDNIKELRKTKHLTQKELAEKTGLSEISIRRYEKGINEPSTKTLKKIADALETPIETILSINLISIADNMKKSQEQFTNLIEEQKRILNDHSGELSLIGLLKSGGLTIKGSHNQFNEDIPEYNLKYKSENFNISEDDFKRLLNNVLDFAIKEALNSKIYDFIYDPIDE